MRRLEAAEALAVERDGRTMTIASSTAGDRLVVTTEGDRAVGYQVTFESIDNGRSLRVGVRASCPFGLGVLGVLDSALDGFIPNQ